jgi:serine/threonine protein kinase
MDVLMDRRRRTLQQPFASGGEADIYRVDGDLAAKIYHAHIISSARRLKVLALCNSYANNVQQFGNLSFAFPRVAAYIDREELDLLCGFGMTFFANTSEVTEIGYDLKTCSFIASAPLNDDTAVEFVYRAFELVSQLHKARIILGDVNPRNVLINWDSRSPLLVDLDSTQVGQFRCTGWSPEYIDPLVQLQGRNAVGGYTYSMEADVFSMACVLCEFLVGAHPYAVRVRPTLTIEERKLKGASYLHLLSGKGWPSGVVHVDAAIEQEILARLGQIGTKWPKLLEFFRGTFVDNRRVNLVETLDRSDPRHPAFVFYSSSGFSTVLQKLVQQKHVAADAGGVRSQVKVPDSGFSQVVGTSRPPLARVTPPQVLSSSAAHHVHMPESGFFQLLAKVWPTAAGRGMPSPVSAPSDPPGLLMFATQYKIDLTNYI